LGDRNSNRPRNTWGEKFGLAEGTGEGFGKIWHQIGHQRKKSTGRKFGGAPEDAGMPRICGLGRGNAASWKRLRRRKFLVAAL